MLAAAHRRLLHWRRNAVTDSLGFFGKAIQITIIMVTILLA